MRSLTDTWTMAKRSLRHTARSLDTIITVVLTPIGILLLFVYVFGGARGEQTGSIEYVDFITPGVVIVTVVSSIAYAALRLSMDLQKGIISRFRTMPVAPSSVLSGQALSSTLSALFSCFLVVMVALLVGFRPAADPAAWLGFCGLLVLFTLATTWLAMVFGLLAKTVEGAGAFSYILLLLIFIRSLVRPDRLHDAIAERVRREPADDTDHRNHALTTDRGHPRPRPLGRPGMGRGHPGRLLHARARRLSPQRAYPGSPVEPRSTSNSPSHDRPASRQATRLKPAA
jgi:ABC-2 type transport system permease protein